MDLLSLADPNQEIVDTYLPSSELFVASEGREKGARKGVMEKRGHGEKGSGEKGSARLCPL